MQFFVELIIKEQNFGLGKIENIYKWQIKCC